MKTTIIDEINEAIESAKFRGLNKIEIRIKAAIIVYISSAAPFRLLKSNIISEYDIYNLNVITKDQLDNYISNIKQYYDNDYNIKIQQIMSSPLTAMSIVEISWKK